MTTPLYIVHPGTDTPADEAEHLVETIAEEWGIQPLPWMKRELLKALQAWPASMLLEAIGRTARAPRPSWAYLNAILQNWQAAGIYDAERLAASDERHHRNQQPPRRVTAQCYEQREYTDAELLAVSGDLIAEAAKYKEVLP